MDRLPSSTSSTTNTSIPSTLNNMSEAHPEQIKYLAALDAWAGKEANGLHAAEKIRQWLDNGDADATLNLYELDLHSLPPLPNNLRKLIAAKNKLVDIPENHLPAFLEALDIHGNQLSSLPASLPIAHLRLLNVAGNNLASLPSATRMLDPCCKVFFSGNNLDSKLLGMHFGPEQDRYGMRQLSTIAEFSLKRDQNIALLRMMCTLLMLPDNLGLPLCTQDLEGMTSFTNFLTQMYMAPYVKNAKLRGAIEELIKKMATDYHLCEEVFSLTIQSGIPDHHQLAHLFSEIRHLVTLSDIKDGKYSGKLPEFVEVVRQRFRGEAISRWAFSRFDPEAQKLSSLQNKAWGDIATFISPFIDLDLKIDPVDTTNSSSSFDIIELSQIIPNHIKDWENKQFPAYFCDRKSPFFKLMRIVDPKIGKIMDNDMDTEGNKLDGEALSSFHVNQLNDYFSRLGQLSLLAPVWPPIADPTQFSFELDKAQVNISDPVDLSQMSPEDRAKFEKCQIQ